MLSQMEAPLRLVPQLYSLLLAQAHQRVNLAQVHSVARHHSLLSCLSQTGLLQINYVYVLPF